MARAPEDRVKNQRQEMQQLRRTIGKRTNRKRTMLPVEQNYTTTTVCVLRLAGYSKTQICQATGISKGQLKEIYESEQFTTQFATLAEVIPQAAIDLLQSLMIEAVMTLADVMRTELDGKVRIAAAESLLDRGGAPKLSRTEKQQTNTDEVVITDGGLFDKIKGLPLEVQEQAAQLIEGLENLLLAHAGQNPSSEVEREVDES